MSRLSLFFIGTALLAVGCAHKNQQQEQMMAPPPGWNAAPPPGAVVAPAPSGCSSCAGSQPVVTSPRYSPPIPASPPLTSLTPLPAQTQGVVIGSPVVTPVSAPLQAAFKPSLPYLESAKLGGIQAEEAPAIPTPPADAPDANLTRTPAKS